MDLSNHTQGTPMTYLYSEIALSFILVFVFWKYNENIQFFFEKLELNIVGHSRNKFEKKIFQLLYLSGKTFHEAQAWIKQQWLLLKILIIISIAISITSGNWFWISMPPLYFCFIYYITLSKIQKRKGIILRRIPFVLDMLVLNLESGLDFLSSVEELVEMNMSHPLHQELRLTLQSVHLGEMRIQAFTDMAERTQVPELSSLAMVIGQSESMGSSLTELLRIQSLELRNRIFKIAEAQAQKAPVKILLPMIGFIFPVVFILLFVPIGIQVFRMFGP